MAKRFTLSEKTLDLLGLRQKDLDVYTTVLTLGTAPLRKIAEEAGLNRGTTYDALKRLMTVHLVSYVDSKTHRYFTSEDPIHLRALATRRQVQITEAREKVVEALPILQELAGRSAHRPTVRYYEGEVGIRQILEDVLYVSESQNPKSFRIYSSSEIRDLIASAWPGFKKRRVKLGVAVQTISFGEGGALIGLDERKWLSRSESAPTYIFVYGHKTAYVSVDDRDRLFGVIIEDQAIAATQRLIFDKLWGSL